MDLLVATFGCQALAILFTLMMLDGGYTLRSFVAMMAIWDLLLLFWLSDKGRKHASLGKPFYFLLLNAGVIIVLLMIAMRVSTYIRLHPFQ